MGSDERPAVTEPLQDVVERTAASVPGTVAHRFGFATLHRRGYPHAEVSTEGTTSWITLHIAAYWPGPVEELLTTTRDRVQERLARLAGARIAHVDVVVHLITRDRIGRRLR